MLFYQSILFESLVELNMMYVTFLIDRGKKFFSVTVYSCLVHIIVCMTTECMPMLQLREYVEPTRSTPTLTRHSTRR